MNRSNAQEIKILKYKITDDERSDLYINMYVQVYRRIGFAELNRINAILITDARMINPCLKMGVLMYKIT